MRDTGHLPLFGVGPACVASMACALAVSLALWKADVLASGHVPGLAPALVALGAALAVGGAAIWVQAVLVADIDRAVKQGELVTNGIYAWVRNPIYTAIAMMLSGAGLLTGNAWFLLLPPVFWLDVTVWVRASEEKWLSARFGEAYADYCARVNRCIPCPPRTPRIPRTPRTPRQRS